MTIFIVTLTGLVLLYRFMGLLSPNWVALATVSWLIGLVERYDAKHPPSTLNPIFWLDATVIPMVLVFLSVIVIKKFLFKRRVVKTIGGLNPAQRTRVARKLVEAIFIGRNFQGDVTRLRILAYLSICAALPQVA